LFLKNPVTITVGASMAAYSAAASDVIPADERSSCRVDQLADEALSLWKPSAARQIETPCSGYYNILLVVSDLI
jgi:hypothetical protein